VAQTAHGATRMAQTEVAQTVVAQLGTPLFIYHAKSYSA